MGGGPDMPPGGLNRTFYGIETGVEDKYKQTAMCLNRTFYGIETTAHYR